MGNFDMLTRTSSSVSVEKLLPEEELPDPDSDPDSEPEPDPSSESFSPLDVFDDRDEHVLLEWALPEWALPEWALPEWALPEWALPEWGLPVALVLTFGEVSFFSNKTSIFSPLLLSSERLNMVSNWS